MYRKRILYFSLIVVISLSLFFALFIKTDRFYTHFFYIPIAMAAIWFPRMTLPIGGAFACYHILLDVLATGTLAFGSCLRAIIIVIVSFALYTLNWQQQQTERQINALDYSSSHDSLTNLYNRRYFDTALLTIHTFPTALFIFDIDNLKHCNDHFGHPRGDQLIKDAAECLVSCTRNCDVLARIGGDEFGLIIDQCNQAYADVILSRLKEMLSPQGSFEVLSRLDPELSPQLSISFGYCIATSPEDLKTLFAHADQAMYSQKASKKAHAL